MEYAPPTGLTLAAVEQPSSVTVDEGCETYLSSNKRWTVTAQWKLLTPPKEVLPDTKGWVVFSFRMFTPWGTMTSEPLNIIGCPWAWFEPFE